MSLVSMLRAEIRHNWKDDARGGLVEAAVVAYVRRMLENAASVASAEVYRWSDESDPVIDDLPERVAEAIRRLGK